MYGDQFGEFVCGYWGVKGYMKPIKSKKGVGGVGFWEGGCPYSLSILSIITVIVCAMMLEPLNILKNKESGGK